MKLAILGSRSILDIDIANYITSDVSEIISGGAVGIDTLAEEFADKKRLTKHIFRPQYELYRKNAPLVRNRMMIDFSDAVLVFWDGKSKGTLHSIKYAEKIKKSIEIITVGKD